MSRASHEVGLGPGARRVSPSLDPRLREGRVAESGPGPGPRATLAGGGAGGACRRRPSGDASGGGGAEAGLRSQGNRARGWGPTRAGPGPQPSEVRGLEKRSPARLSASGDLGLTKPRGEWGAGKRWTLRLMFLGAPFSDSALEPSSWEALRLPPAQGQRCSRDTQVRNDASLRKGPVLRRSRSLTVPAEEARDQGSHPLYGARLKSSPFALPVPGAATQRNPVGRGAQTLRPPHSDGARPGPLLPPRTPTPPTLSASQARQALASPGCLSHFGTRPRPAVPRPPCLPAAASLLPVLARRCGPGGPRSPRAGSGPAPRRLRSPWWELGRGVMSV